MSIWANYLISAVRYSTNNSKIDYFMVHVDNGDSVGSGVTWNRNKVLEYIVDYSFCTIIKNFSNEWSKGANINVISYNNEKYLRTDPNNTPKDNLGNLPEF